MLSANSTELYANVIHSKPDLLILEEQLKKANIVEVSSPYDAFVDQCYNTKFMYTVLCVNSSISTGNTHAKSSSSLLLGLQGVSTKNVVPGLKILGFDTRIVHEIGRFLLPGKGITRIKLIYWYIQIYHLENSHV